MTTATVSIAYCRVDCFIHEPTDKRAGLPGSVLCSYRLERSKQLNSVCSLVNYKAVPVITACMRYNIGYFDPCH